jgi:hypothetical protein
MWHCSLDREKFAALVTVTNERSTSTMRPTVVQLRKRRLIKTESMTNEIDVVTTTGGNPIADNQNSPQPI